MEILRTFCTEKYQYIIKLLNTLQKIPQEDFPMFRRPFENFNLWNDGF